MSTNFGEMIDTLSEAHRAVRTELEWFSEARGRDGEALLSLGHSVRSLAGQADSLLVLMTEHGATEALVEAAEELFDVFHDTEVRIEALLRAS